MRGLGLGLGFGLQRSPIAKSAAQQIKEMLSPAGQDYAYWDYADATRRFLQHIGPDAAAVGGPVGLLIDKNKKDDKTLDESQIGANVVFSRPTPIASTAGFTGVNAAISIVAGRIRVTNTVAGQFGYAYAAVPCVVGRMYRLKELGEAAPGGGGQVSAFHFGPTQAGSTDGFANAPQTGQWCYAIASAATMYIALQSQGNTTNGYRDHGDIVIEEVVDSHLARQNINNSRPALQADGIKFDGSDDRWLTDWTPAGNLHAIIIRTQVPATLGVTNFIAGAQDASINRFFFGLNEIGNTRFAYGNNSGAIGNSDVRGKTVTLAFVADGANLNSYVDGVAQHAPVAISGVPATIAAAIGALNANGSFSGHYGGLIKQVLFGKVGLTQPQVQQIHNLLAAA